MADFIETKTSTDFKSVKAIKALKNKISDKLYQDMFAKMQNDKRFENLVNAVSIDKLTGGGSFKKFSIK